MNEPGSAAVVDAAVTSAVKPGKMVRVYRPAHDRLVPDVSLAADPNTGACVILHGERQQIGGTSWSAPVWAGFCALINEARAKAGKPSLSFLPPMLYPLLGSDSFRDITAGNNGEFSATPATTW